MNNTRELRTQLTKLRQQLVSVGEKLSSLSSCIAAETVPESELINSAISDLANLSNVQKDCATEFASVFPDKKMPRQISEVERIADEFDSALKEAEKKGIWENAVQKFRCIKSDVDAVAAMLKEYLDKLSSLPITDMSYDETEKSIYPYERFYTAVEISDLHERMTVINEIENAFSSDILMKVMQGKMYISSDDIPSINNNNVEDNSSENTPVIVASEERSDSGKDLSTEAESDSEDGLDKFSTEIRDTCKKIVESGLIYGPVYDSKKLIIEKATDNLDLSKEALAKTFKKYKLGNGFLMFMGLKGNCLFTIDRVNQTNVNGSRVEFTGCAESLFKSGYINKIVYDENILCYVISQDLAENYPSKDLGKVIIGILKGKLPNISSKSAIFNYDYNDLVGCLYKNDDNATGVFFNCYYYDKFITCICKAFSVFNSMNTFELCSRNSLIKTPTGEKVAYASIFPTCEEDICAYLVNINDLKDHYNNASIAIIAASTVSQAEVLKSYLSSIISFSDNCKWVYFVSNDFVTHYDGTVIDDEKLIEMLRNTHSEKSEKAHTIEKKSESENNPLVDDVLDDTNEDSVSDKEEEQKANLSEKAESIPLDMKVNDSDRAASELSDNLKESDKSDINPNDSVSMTSEQVITENKLVFDADEVKKSIISMLQANKPYCASLYLKLISDRDSRYLPLYNAMAYALNDPMKKPRYSSAEVISVFGFDIPSGFEDIWECFKVLASLRVFYYDESIGDYSIRQLYDTVSGSSIFTNKPALKELTYALSDFKNKTLQGIDAYADYRTREIKQKEQNIQVLVNNAQNQYTQYIESHIRVNSSFQRYVDTLDITFKKDGDIAEILDIIRSDMRDKEYINRVEELLHKTFFNEDDKISVSTLKKDGIEKYIDLMWDEAGRKLGNKHKSTALMSGKRQSLFNKLENVAKTASKWVEEVTSNQSETLNTQYTRDKNKIKELISNALLESEKTDISDSTDKACYQIIDEALKEFNDRLVGSFVEQQHRYYSPFLKERYITLDEDFLPIIDPNLDLIKNYSDIQRVIYHFESSEKSLEDRLDEIFNRTENSMELDLGDDYGTAARIRELGVVKEWPTEFDIGENSKQAENEHKSTKQNFIGTLELAQSYGQITNDVKEQMLLLLENTYERAIKTSNYGFFRRFLSACIEMIKSEAKTREAVLKNSLDKISTKITDDNAIRMLEEARQRMVEQNYTVVEDIITRISNGDIIESKEDYEDYLEEFLGEYDNIYQYVKDTNVSFQRAVGMYTPRRTLRMAMKDKKGRDSIINNFPSGTIFSVEKIKQLLISLGFDVEKVTDNGTHLRSCKVTLRQLKNGEKFSAAHNISAFGSRALDFGIDIMCLFGNYDQDRLIEELKSKNRADVIVLLDYALKLTDRHTIARKLKTDLHANYLVIDRVSAAFLANNFMKAPNVMNKMLMEISMPFSYYQPYLTDSSKTIPPEMFVGREEQLRRIKNYNGANILSGGRQLGKSAILRKAKSDVDRDVNGRRAIYVDIRKMDYKKAAKTVSLELVDSGILPKGCETDDWQMLCSHIRSRLRDDIERIPYLLLLIDEADTFIDSCKDIEYAPIGYLEDVQSEEGERFKFVIAGLRNLVKFEKEAATSDNSVLAHMSSETIRPFTYTEAKKLLVEPLHYLGLRFEKEELITLILANTNYFPGLIHFYCAKLLDAMYREDYAGYNEIDTPPYIVTEQHIKKVLADPEFNDQIRDKLYITLKLDTDDYYLIIAILMAYCYYNYNEQGLGFSAIDLYKEAVGYGIKKIVDLGIDKLKALMDELCELNVLRRSSDEMYLFARYNFIQLLGSREDIDNQLCDYSS